MSPLGRYRYRLKWLMRTGYLAFTVLVWWASIMLFLSGEHDAFNYGILLTFGSIVVTGMSVNAVLLTSDVIVNNEGIGHVVGTYRWQFCRWDEVSCCRARVRVSLQSTRPRFIYNIIHSKDSRFYFLPNGPLIFDEDILSASELLGDVNKYIQKWHIPVTMFDARIGGQPVSLNKLPNPLSAK